MNFEIGVNFCDVSIVGFHVVNADARNILPSISRLTTTKVMKQGYIAITITWADASNDVDFGLLPMTPSWGVPLHGSMLDWSSFHQNSYEGGSLAYGNYESIHNFIQHLVM